MKSYNLAETLNEVGEAEEVEEAEALLDHLSSLLHGKGPYIQGAVLLELLAIWVRGHLVLGDKAATREYRETLLKSVFESLALKVSPDAIDVDISKEMYQ